MITPPIFSGVGTLSSGFASVSSFAASYQGQTITPLAGQQVSGNGVASGTVILASPAPTATTFTLSQPATASGPASLTIGAEPVTLAEAKQFARVEFPDDDNLITKLMAQARRFAEGPRLKRAIMLQSRCMYFMGFPWTGGYYNRLIRSMGPNPWWLPTAQGIIMLAYPPLQAVTSIQYVDPSSGNLLTIDPTTYLFTANSTPGRVQPQYGKVWPLARPVIDAVQITYTCGYGAFETDVPEDVQLGILGLVASSYENREADLDVELSTNPAWSRAFWGEDYGVYV